MSSPTFGTLLREWRRVRRMSQQQLSLEAEVSARHLSFLETGKSAPSRTMVLVLASALDLPLRDRNVLLQAAGFANAYRESGWEDDTSIPLRRTLDLILRYQEPIPAVGVTPLWDVVQMNAAALRVFTRFLPPDADEIVGRNVMHALFNPSGLRRFVVNWEEVSQGALERIHQEALAEPDGAGHERLLASLASYPDMSGRARTVDLGAPLEVCVPLHLERDDLELRFFTTIATIGTPVDVSAQELRVEAYLPADDATERWLRAAHSSEEVD